MVYLCIGIIGFFTFGYAVSSNLIGMYPPGPIITAGQFAIAILVLLSYPLQCHPCRASLDKVLRKGDPQPMSRTQFNTITTCILVFSYLIAISVKNLATILALVGATGSTTICYILPGFLYYNMVEKDRAMMGLSRKEEWLRGVAYGLGWVGVVLMILSVSVQVYSWGQAVH